MSAEVILVNENDEQVGTMDKLEAHKQAKLHRAFSVFIFNSKGQMLLQQRAAGKYHSAGLWTNACCSHPAPGEDTNMAAQRSTRCGHSLFCETYLQEGFFYQQTYQWK